MKFPSQKTHSGKSNLLTYSSKKWLTWEWDKKSVIHNLKSCLSWTQRSESELVVTCIIILLFLYPESSLLFAEQLKMSELWQVINLQSSDITLNSKGRIIRRNPVSRVSFQSRGRGWSCCPSGGRGAALPCCPPRRTQERWSQKTWRKVSCLVSKIYYKMLKIFF